MLDDDYSVGAALAVSSSLFIGASFVVKKRGLRIAAGSGTRAGPHRPPRAPPTPAANARRRLSASSAR
jgi:hypothetical protein